MKHESYLCVLNEKINAFIKTGNSHFLSNVSNQVWTSTHKLMGNHIALLLIFYTDGGYHRVPPSKTCTFPISLINLVLGGISIVSNPGIPMIKSSLPSLFISPALTENPK